jgi:hypothetical protein
MQTQLQTAPCPKYGSIDAKKVSFTWWGGALGPRLFNLVKCNSYCTEYNGKTGKPNQHSMINNMIVFPLIVFCLCGGLSFLETMLNQH